MEKHQTVHNSKVHKPNAIADFQTHLEHHHKHVFRQFQDR